MTDAARPVAVLVDREGLGDALLKAPFLRALRRAFPGRDVWWIANHQTCMEDELRPLFQRDIARVVGHAGLDGAARDILARLRRLPPFEQAFDARTKISTVAITRAGLRSDGFYCCLPGYILCDGRPPSRRRPRRIAERMLSLVTAATGAPADGSGWLEASAEAQAAARSFLPGGPRYVGIAPGSRQPIKNWPIERFTETARALMAEGLTPVFRLGPMEADIRARIAAEAPGSLISPAARPDGGFDGASLDHFIAETQRLTLMLGNDNGVGHLAGGAGTPVVSLFGPTDPRRWRPFAPLNRIIRAQEFGGAAMEAIPVRAVVDAVLETLAASQPPPPAMKS